MTKNAIMIEVEQKFILSEEDIERLTADAVFLSEKTLTDTYYDTADFALTKNDMWLRKRGEEFDLKLPMHIEGNKFMNQYQEVEGEDKIREIFSIALIGDFVEDIKVFGYESFCQCSTTRRKFKKDGFNIDLDTVEYGDFTYNIAEIELMVNNKTEISEAMKKIEAFAKENGLKIENVRGKVIEYLLRKKPRHYRALVGADVVKE